MMMRSIPVLREPASGSLPDDRETGEGFYRALLESIAARDPAVAVPTLDPDRFRRRLSVAWAVGRWLRSVIWRWCVRPTLATGADRARRYAPLLPRLAWLHESLADEYSRRLLVDLVAFRMLGHERIALPLNTAEYWAQRDWISRMRVGEKELKIGFLDWRLHEYDLSPLGFHARVMVRVPTVQHIFVLEQYRYQRSATIGAEPGDTVIDAGSCWGEAAIYFADRVGAAGRVFAFEFNPGNLQVLEQNLSANPDLAKRIEVVRCPLWSTPGEVMYYQDNGPGSLVSRQPSRGDTTTVASTSIDAFVRESGLTAVHLIKMDIEGAELEALRGAQGTLKRFRPKLAVSVYHKPEDFVEIPEYLRSLGLGYDLYLDHFTTHGEESVLFARPV